jgi:hypothetical protein
VRTYAKTAGSNVTCGYCPYDCYSCNSNGDCLTCNATTDFRELNGVRCDPLQGYYETEVTVAGKCPAACTTCTSLTVCTSCDPGFELSEFGCQTFCPTNSTNNDSSTCQDLMPNLYMDRVFVWTTGGPTKLASAGGYNFSLTWRHSISGVFATALGLYNYKVASRYILSYKAELLSPSTTGATLNVDPVSTDAGIVFLAFTVVVITQDQSYLELVTFEKTGIDQGVYPPPTLLANSSKFDFTSEIDTPATVTFYQWVTGSVNVNYTTIDYWSYAWLTYSPLASSSNNSELTLTFSVGSYVYMTAVKVQVLLVGRTAGLKGSAIYQITSVSGKYFTRSFWHNLGVPTAYFGQPSSARSCLLGLSKLDIYLYRDPSEVDPSYFIFQYNGSEISDLIYSNIYGATL